MKKLLILNGGYSEIPLITAAKSEGYYVIVIGNNENAPGNLLADEYCRIDYSDKEAVCKIATEKMVEGIVSACNDRAYESKVYSMAKLRMATHDSMQVVNQLHNKNEFRNLEQLLGIPTPAYTEVHSSNELNAMDNISYPILVKPINMDGGRSVAKCWGEDELRNTYCSFRIAHPNTGYVVEEFLEGTNHGFTTLIKNQKVIFFMADIEYHSYYDYAVSAVSVPSMLDKDTEHEMVRQIEVISSSLNLSDGLMHAQFILTERGPYILEICRRPPGDLYIEFVKYVTGIDYPLAIVSSEIGDMKIRFLHKPKENVIARQVLICQEKGRIKKIKYSLEFERHIKEKYEYYDKERTLNGEMYKCGVVFLETETHTEMYELLTNIKEHISFDMIQGEN